jgi:hypothetical protein
VYLRELTWLAISAKDTNGQLDLDQVKEIRLGGNFAAKGLDKVSVTASHFMQYTSTDVPIVAEAENGTRSAGWGIDTNAGYSAGRYLDLWQSAAPGPEGYWADVPLNVPAAGRYEVYFCGNALSRLASPCSISPFSWRLDDGKEQLVNVPMPQQTPLGIRELAETPALLDTVQLSAGTHVFHLSVNTRRVACDTNYALWFDAVVLRPVAAAKTK